MKVTSEGFHTFNIFRKLTLEEGDAALTDAYEYRNRTGNIRIRQLRMDDCDYDLEDFTNNLSSRSRYFLIEYTAKHML